MAKGSAQENRDYIIKGGKWSETDKAHTSVEGSFEEWGEVPSAKAEKAPVMTRVIEALKEGQTTAQIIEKYPGLALKVQQIDALRQTILGQKYMMGNRDVKVTYLYGASGAGKTRGIYARHNPIDVCRLTSYGSKRGINFDGYCSHDVLVFEEFASQISIEDMLSYLDIYPLRLPARYNDKVACFTKVYITSNLPLEQQYMVEQMERPETWKAFLRRIDKVIEYKPDGTTIEHNKEDLL